MDAIRRIFYFFAPYTDSRERAVSLFFKSLTEHSDQAETRHKLYELLQRDIAVINLWTEYRYKGYKYLRKSHRKKLYANLDLIAEDFDTFRSSHLLTASKLDAQLQALVPNAHMNKERIILLQTIMQYFSPSRGVYEYKESSSFGRILKNPSKELLIGDCNQIVTLYIYIYSRYYDIRDLKIRLLPEHVALHYEGVDIEATNGTFKKYDDEAGAQLMPIEEIVSVNLLDTTDSYLATHEVDPEDFLQASRFAFILSHHRAIVKHNLDAAYGKLINTLMDRHNFTQALKFAKASRDVELLAVVGHNGAVHSMQQHHFTVARQFAAHALKRDDLIRDSYHAEGVYHYEAQRYHDAIKAFRKINDKSLVNRCYEALFFEEQGKLGKNLTIETIKKHASTVKRMRTYAKKSGNPKLLESADAMVKYL